MSKEVPDFLIPVAVEDGVVLFSGDIVFDALQVPRQKKILLPAYLGSFEIFNWDLTSIARSKTSHLKFRMIEFNINLIAYSQLFIIVYFLS